MRLDVQARAEERIRAAIKADPDLAALADATPAQVNAWVDNVVANTPNTVAGIKALIARSLKVLLKVAIIVLRRL